MEAAIIQFNATLRINVPSFDPVAHGSLGLDILYGKHLVRALKKTAVKYLSDDLFLLSTTPVADDGTGVHYTDVKYLSEYVCDANGYNSTSTDEFFTLLTAVFETVVSNGNITGTVVAAAGKTSNSILVQSLIGATVVQTPTYATPVPPYNTPTQFSDFVEFMRLETPNPNPFGDFCALGCSYFFSTHDMPSTLLTCTEKCDHEYRSKAHITVHYSDLAETARLECRDGCQIALKRCQPGYKCTQTVMVADPVSGDDVGYTEGQMEVCPPGTYRDFSYEQVEACVDCPPGRYREAEKGRYMESCSKCPVGKYVNHTGSSSILECDRCPAGRFGRESGLAICTCITERSCQEPQTYASPANADKRESFPFEGRW